MRISGPASAVRQTSEARTREIPLLGRKASFEELAWIDVSSPDVRIQGDQRVRVQINVAERIGEKVFSELPVQFLHTAAMAQANPRVVRATVRGPVRVLAQLTREDLRAVADLEGLEPRAAEYHQTIRIEFTREQFRDKLQLLGSQPAAVGVRITSGRSSSRGAPRARELERGG